MKVYISYFYKVRFFKRNMVPFSTACYPPKWWLPQHKDKNGVWNGISVKPLVPGSECNGLCRGPEFCSPPQPSKCKFLKKYREQLDTLDFNKVCARLEAIAAQVKQDEGFEEEPEIVLLVFEAPQNPCSERRALQEWFRDNGVELPEWQSNN